MTRPVMISGTDQAEAWRLPPITTHRLPSKMQFLRPSGSPLVDTKGEQTAAAKVYEDATMGMMYAELLRLSILFRWI